MSGLQYIAAALQPVSGSKVYAIGTAISDKIEPLSANDALVFVEDQPASYATVLGLSSGKLLQSLPVVANKIARKQRLVLAVQISSGDYSVVTAAKDLGAVALVATSAKETGDFFIVANLLAKQGQSALVFYSEEPENEYKGVAEAYESFQGETVADAFAHLHKLVGRQYTELEVSPSASWFGTRKTEQIIVLLGDPAPIADHLVGKSAVLFTLKVYRPFPAELLKKQLSRFHGYTTIHLVEQSSLGLQFSPLLLDTIEIIQGSGAKAVSSQLLQLNSTRAGAAVNTLLTNGRLAKPIQNLTLGKAPEEPQTSEEEVHASPDNAYLQILNEVGPNVRVLNDYKTNPSPAYTLGRFLHREKQRDDLAALVESKLPRFTGLMNSELARWLLWARNQDDLKDHYKYSSGALLDMLSRSNRTAATQLLEYKEFFDSKTGWIVGSDSWSYDTGLATFHQVLQSGNKHLKLLIIDSDASVNQRQSKKNLGLYALNYGKAYVASVSLYSSYTQTLTAFLEASEYHDGPAIILAYLPRGESHLDILKASKEAVDTGFWPLYRFNPQLPKFEDTFQLDSSFVRRELQDFLDAQNRLTLLAAKSAKLQYNLQTYNSAVENQIQHHAKSAYETLLENMAGDPLTVAYASDNGNAAGLANRLFRRAASKGLKARVLQLDELSLEELPLETNLVVITSTSGQGEFPSGGKTFWEALKSSTVDLANVNAAVFGLGDSKYWPRAEDARYFNKPSRDIYNRLSLLGAHMLNAVGQGDDQDADGFNTAYDLWEPEVWKALGVSAENADEPPPITNEDMKRESNFLRGTIKEGLADTSTGSMSASDQQLTKFHGVYLQDDRDLRDNRKAEGLEPAFAFMVRVRLPGNVSTPDQWLAIDRLCEEKGNHTFKITTRGTYQLHGIVKKDLVSTVHDINATAMDTLGACGDVNRNSICSAAPKLRHIHEQMAYMAKIVSRRLLPNTTAYHELFLTELGEVKRGPEGGPKRVKVGGNAVHVQDTEPLYGNTYLPRKLKVAITVPPYNDVDVFANDIGLISIVEKGEIVGFNLSLGGGMGTTHNNTKTYPRAGTVVGYLPYDKAPITCEKVLILQRDNGDRKNRKHARLKYTLDDMGVEVFKKKLEELQGFDFEPARPFHIESNHDFFGWCKDEAGFNHYTCYIENGRVDDQLGAPHRTGLRKIAELMKSSGVGGFRLTGNQHVILSDITDKYVPQFKALLEQYALSENNFSGLRMASQCCVAFPTCGLAMAEAERYFPQFLTKLEGEMDKLGLRDDSVVFRMTGCPNGCARPWLAEVALVGKSYGIYNLLLGGSFNGERVNKLYKSNVDEAQAFAILIPLFSRWAAERHEGEHFGDYVIRAGIIKPTLEGKHFWDDLNPDV